MKRFAIGFVLLAAVAMASPAAWACGYLCVWEGGCGRCIYTGDPFSGCTEYGSCGCFDSQCWAPAPANDAAAMAAFEIFSTPETMTSAQPSLFQ